MKYVLGIDIGSQSLRVFLFDEKLEAVSHRSTAQYIEVERPLWATQNANLWWPAICGSIRSILGETGVDPKDILSVGCCAHMHGAVPLDKQGELLDENIQLYCDKRTYELVGRLYQDGTAEELYETAGNIPATSWFGLKIRWIRENQPKLYDAIHKVLTPKDYINFKLTGMACIDPTEASGSLLLDVATGQWSDLLIRKIGIDREKLPAIVPATAVVGEVSRQAAAETGLYPGTKVAAGSGDMPTSMYISGIHRKNVIVDLSATTGVIACHSRHPILDRRLLNIHSPVSGWIVYRSLDGSGADYRWLRDTLAAREVYEAEKAGADPYDYLSSLAEKTPAGANGLLFLPHFLGERTMGSMHSRGAFIGLHLGTELPIMTRALLEGVAFDLKRTIDVLEADNVRAEVVHHVSGAAKSPVWSQIKADIYQKPVYTLQGNEDSVLGAALLGGVAVGLFSSPAEAVDAAFSIKDIFEPNPCNKQLYEDLYHAFCQAHDALQPVYERLSIHY